MARRVQEDELRKKRGITPDRSSKLNKVKNLTDVSLHADFGGVFSLQYNFDGSHVCAGFTGGGIRMYNSETGEMIRELRPNRHGGYGVMCLRYHPIDHIMLYAATAEGHIYLINTDTGESNHIITEPHNQINTMDFCLDAFNFCTCGKDLAVRVYDAKSSQLTKTFEAYGVQARENPQVEEGNTMRVYALKFHPDNENIFISAGWDNHIKIWDIRTNDGIKRQIHGPHVCGDALDMKDRHILSGSWSANHALQEWDYGEGKLVRDIKFPHKNGAFLYCAQYGDMGVVLAGGSGTNSVEAIESATDKHIGSVALGDHPVQAMDSANGGRLFAVAGGGNVVKLCAMKG